MLQGLEGQNSGSSSMCWDAIPPFFCSLNIISSELTQQNSLRGSKETHREPSSLPGGKYKSFNLPLAGFHVAFPPILYSICSIGVTACYRLTRDRTGSLFAWRQIQQEAGSTTYLMNLHGKVALTNQTELTENTRYHNEADAQNSKYCHSYPSGLCRINSI